MSKIETTGRHEVVVKTAQFGESNTGTPFVQFRFENADGGYIAGWVYLSEAAFAKAVQTLRDAFGFDGNFETLIDQVTGKKCAITVEQETYEGKPRFKVKWINRLAAPVKPISGDQGSFLKKLTSQAARIPAEAPKKAASGAKPAPKQKDEFLG